MLKIRIVPEAVEEIHNAVEWYDDQRAGLGSAFLLSIEGAMSKIKRIPEAFPKIEGNIRRIRTKRFPYGIYYFVEEDTAVVLAVLHGARKPGLWKDRE